MPRAECVPECKQVMESESLEPPYIKLHQECHQTNNSLTGPGSSFRAYVTTFVFDLNPEVEGTRLRKQSGTS